MYIPKDFKLQNQLELQNRIKNLQSQYASAQTSAPKAPEVVICPNPVYKTNELLEEQNEKISDLSVKLEEAHLEISKQTKELQSIHYQNIKLNSQIDTLNKTIDFQDNELDKLRNVNSELKIINQTLENSNKHYWRNTFIISFVVAGIFFILGYLV